MGAVVNGSRPGVQPARSDVATVRPGQPRAGGNRRRRRTPASVFFRVLKRVWLPLVIVAVVIAGGWSVSRLHGIFGHEASLSYGDTRSDETTPVDPKHLRYEVFGPPGTSADISYFGADGDPQFARGVPLPWSLEFPITTATGVGSVAAQSDGDSIGCRLLVDEVVKDEKTTYAVSAFTSCLLKAA